MCTFTFAFLNPHMGSVGGVSTVHVLLVHDMYSRHSCSCERWNCSGPAMCSRGMYTLAGRFDKQDMELHARMPDNSPFVTTWRV